MMSPSIRVQRAVTARETWVVVLVVLPCVAVPTALAMGFLWRAMDQERAARQAQEGSSVACVCWMRRARWMRGSNASPRCIRWNCEGWLRRRRLRRRQLRACVTASSRCARDSPLILTAACRWKTAR